MTATFERIKKDIRSLAPNEVEILLRDLQNEYVMPIPNGEDDSSVEAVWDAEISSRVRDIEEGKVELISSEESDRRTDALFAKLGIQRPVIRS